MFYNWTKVHKTLRVTPATAAGLTDRVWEMADVVALIEEAEMLVPAAQADWTLPALGNVQRAQIGGLGACFYSLR